MTFRKNALFFWEAEIFFITMGLLCLLLVPAIGLFVPLLNALLFSILALTSLREAKQLITINDAGISCHQAGKQCWAYGWDNIAELRRGTRFRNPSVEVIVYDKTGKPEQYARPDHFFQLGKSAKKALKHYSSRGRFA